MTDLSGFADDTRAAVATAQVEAATLGLGAVGTEHLLLGLLLGDSRASRTLVAAGATVAAARHKVAEASGGGRGPARETASTMTGRAERALGRAVRFSHQARAEAVGTDHLLLGILDVEGTAGQVLRGIGVDVAALRTALTAAPAEVSAPVAPSAPATPATPATPVTPAASAPRCHGCGAEVGDLLFTASTATGADGRTGDVVVFSCRSCGVVLGVAPRRSTS